MKNLVPFSKNRKSRDHKLPTSYSVHKETKKPDTQAFSLKKFVQLFFNHA